MYYYFADHLGSTRVVTNASGSPCYESDFLPYGTENTPSGFSNSCSTNYKFTGYERDTETGLDYAFARYYNQRMGRFMSGDPLGGSIDDPQSLNRYTSVRTNPVNLVDPSGMLPTWDERWGISAEFDGGFDWGPGDHIGKSGGFGSAASEVWRGGLTRYLTGATSVQTFPGGPTYIESTTVTTYTIVACAAGGDPTGCTCKIVQDIAMSGAWISAGEGPTDDTLALTTGIRAQTWVDHAQCAADYGDSVSLARPRRINNGTAEAVTNGIIGAVLGNTLSGAWNVGYSIFGHGSMDAGGIISAILGGPALGFPVPKTAPAGLKGVVGVAQEAVEGVRGLTGRIAGTAAYAKLRIRFCHIRNRSGEVPMRVDALDVLFPIVGSLFTTFLGWGVMRGINGGRPLPPFQKGLLFYGYFFLVGTAFSIIFVSRLDLPKPLWLLLTLIWGAVIGKIAQKHYRSRLGRSPGVADVRKENHNFEE